MIDNFFDVKAKRVEGFFNATIFQISREIVTAVISVAYNVEIIPLSSITFRVKYVLEKEEKHMD